ncbi:MAG: hypothetical protein ACREJB_16575 [Planctomycetaceae bacterium]
MAVQTFEGVVENGQIRIESDVTLPERAKVYILIPDARPTPVAHLRSPRLARPEQVADFEKEVLEIDSDHVELVRQAGRLPHGR